MLLGVALRLEQSKTNLITEKVRKQNKLYLLVLFVSLVKAFTEAI